MTKIGDRVDWNKIYQDKLGIKLGWNVMISGKQFFCILLVMAIAAIPAYGEKWKWTDRNEQGSITLGKEILNNSISSLNRFEGSAWIAPKAICAIALFVYANYLETKRHNAIEEEWQRQILENTTHMVRFLR